MTTVASLPALLTVLTCPHTLTLVARRFLGFWYTACGCLQGSWEVWREVGGVSHFGKLYRRTQTSSSMWSWLTLILLSSLGLSSCPSYRTGPSFSVSTAPASAGVRCRCRRRRCCCRSAVSVTAWLEIPAGEPWVQWTMRVDASETWALALVELPAKSPPLVGDLSEQTMSYLGRLLYFSVLDSRLWYVRPRRSRSLRGQRIALRCCVEPPLPSLHRRDL